MNEDKFYLRLWLMSIGVVLMLTGLFIMPIPMGIIGFGSWSIAALLIIGAGLYLLIKAFLFHHLRPRTHNDELPLSAGNQTKR